MAHADPRAKTAAWAPTEILVKLERLGRVGREDLQEFRGKTVTLARVGFRDPLAIKVSRDNSVSPALLASAGRRDSLA